LRIAAIVAMTVLLAGSYRPITSSRLFELEKITIEGNTRVPTSKVEAMIHRVAGENVYQADLSAVRSALKRHPLIKDAIVARLLPDALRVKLIERQPVAVVARSGRLVCVDEEGSIVGDFALMGDQPAPPLLGWAEGSAPVKMAANRQRIQLYLQLQRELSGPGLSYWSQIDQIDVSNTEDVTISLSRNPMTWIHLGDREFRQRLQLGLAVLDAIKNRNREELQRLGLAVSDKLLADDLKINYIDVSRPPRVVVRLPSAKAGSESIPRKSASRR
jgi:cell division protein FtsQ